MGSLAKLIDQHLSSKGSRLVRAVEFANLEDLKIGIPRKAYAILRYVDPLMFRASNENFTDPSFRESFAKEAVVALYDSETYKNDLASLPAFHSSLQEPCCGQLTELVLKILCPSLFTAQLSDSLLVSAENGQLGDRIVLIKDQDDVAAIVKAMDGLMFTMLYYEAISIAEFVRKEVERTKNSLGFSLSSPTQ